MDIPKIEEFETFIFKRSCAKCNYSWFPRLQNPKRCPRCQTRFDRGEDLQQDEKRFR